MTWADVATYGAVRAGTWLNRTWHLPIVAVSPTSRCHSRCVSCDWWRSDGSGDLPLERYATLADELQQLGTRLVLLTGGEPLLRRDLWDIADLFLARGMALQLITSGLALRTHAAAAGRRCRQVVVSLDGDEPESYAQVRGVDGFAAVAEGLAAVRAVAPSTRLIARATLHRRNFSRMSALVETAARLQVDQISFLTADLGSPAFGTPPEGHRRSLALTAAEVEVFRETIERCLRDHQALVTRRFIAESPTRLRRLADYYAAHLGLVPFPAVQCDAPFVSVAIDADGTVRPCFFHPPVGRLSEMSLRDIVRRHLPQFRSQWQAENSPTCRECVCALRVSWRAQPWR